MYTQLVLLIMLNLLIYYNYLYQALLYLNQDLIGQIFLTCLRISGIMLFVHNVQFVKLINFRESKRETIIYLDECVDSLVKS